MKRIVKRVVLALVVAAAAVLIVFALRPKPVEVEVATVVNGPLQVIIDEDGETRARDRFTLAAPVAGRLSRIQLRDGEQVGRNTVIATISPLPLEARELEEIKARIEGAEARKREAEEQVIRRQSECAQAERDVNRARQLGSDHLIPRQEMERAETNYTAAAKELESAKQRARAAEADAARERAGLISQEDLQRQKSKLVEIRPPVRCRILRILEKSERVVSPGTPIVVLSDPAKIEVVVDVLSADAVKVKPGAAVMIENWGGPNPLRAKVRMVEPYGFTKVSALGIEEQRVNIIIDFVDPPEGLGDGYRVEARIVLWESPSVPKIPASALFRSGKDWAVFTTEDGRAKLHVVETGHRNSTEAEIIKGLQEKQAVVLHPPNELADGAAIVAAR